jgi:hypothetical protein
MIGAALVGPLVDSYATPDGVAAILNGIPPRGNPGERPPAPASVAAGSGTDTAGSSANAVTNGTGSPTVPASGLATGQEAPKPPQTTAGYRDFNTFVVTYQHGAGDARYSAIFRRSGLISWKLVAVDLNG